MRELEICADPEALADAWRTLRRDQELGGPYWALLTHPVLTEALANEALGDVHMISHTAGATVRRSRNALARARERISRLQEALLREQDRRRALVERLSELERTLEARPCLPPKEREEPEEAAPEDGDRSSGDDRRRAPATRESGGERGAPGAGETDATLDALRTRLARAEQRARMWRTLYRRTRGDAGGGDPSSGCSPPSPPVGCERCLGGTGGDREPALRGPRPGGETDGGPGAPPDLAGRLVLFVGGRNHIVPWLRTLTERLNGILEHHDGGLEQRPSGLDQAISRADLVVVALDSVSHDATRRLKRRARRLGTPIEWLPSASRSALEALFTALASGERAGDPS